MTPEVPLSPALDRFVKRVAPPLLVVWSAVLAWMVWDKGPDPWIDFGRELYVPWRLLEGDVLYRDIAWFNGPFSPWWNAAWMWLLGVSFDALQWVNLGLALAAGGLLYRLLRRSTDRLAASAGTFVFFGIFAFAQQMSIGNYMFLAPYSHGIVHGTVLGLVALAAFARARRLGSAFWCAVGGAAVGLAFLTKAEVFIAAAGGGALAFLLALVGPMAEGRRGRLALAGIGGGIAPILAAWIVLRTTLGGGEAELALLGTWAHALDDNLSGMRFYRAMRGMERPLEHLVTVARATTAAAFVLVMASIIARRLARRGLAGPFELALLGGGATAFALVALYMTHVERVARPLHLALVLTFIAAVERIARGDDDARERALARIVLVAFAGLLTIKLGLRPSVRGYGFVLAAPGFVLAIATLVHDLPLRMGTGRARMRAMSLGLVVGLTLAHVASTYKWMERRETPVGEGADRVLCTEWRAAEIEELLRVTEAELAARDGDGEGERATLLVLPEGIGMNYWLRRRAPIPVINFMPPEFVMFGEGEIISRLEASPPAVVLLAHKETNEYGYRFFGQGYGDRLLDWVLDRYQPVRRFGAVPLVSDEWGVQVLIPR